MQGKNMDSYINHYIGEWENEAGNRLEIKKVDDETALVSFFSPPDHQPVFRQWYDEKPSIDMIAKYRPAESPDLVVELWEEGKGFELHLTFELGYMLDIQHRNHRLKLSGRNCGISRKMPYSLEMHMARSLSADVMNPDT
jgi:hypothetical protein